MLMTLDAAFERAFAAERRGDESAARAIYDDILAAIPDHPGALLGIARQLRARRSFDDASDVLERALRSAAAMALPAEALQVELARVQWAAGRRAAARATCAAASLRWPQSASPLLAAGDFALADGDFVAAEARFREALARSPKPLAASIGLAQALAGLGRLGEASRALDRAFELDAASIEAFAAAAWVALTSKDWQAAQRHCRAGLMASPSNSTLLRLLGQAQRRAGALRDALRTFERAVEVDPGDAPTRVSLGGLLVELGLRDAAIRELETALALAPASAEAAANLGLAWLAQEDYERAATMFERAIDANPGLVPAIADLAYARAYLCEWDALDAVARKLVATLDDPESDPRLSPFVAVALGFPPQRQLTVSRRWSAAMLPAPAAPGRLTARGDRLRVGYLSSDFRDHATGRLMVALIEAHDRSKLEVFGYGYGRSSDSPLRRRIVAAFDHWRDLAAATDADMAQAIRADRIDVLIDRKGHTNGGRLAALAERPASVQLHYMSFPGTIGYDAIDGLIADDVVIPPADDVCYHERIFRLPRCYFVTDGTREPPVCARRADHGLPEEGLVLASLNQSYKVTRDVFAAWMTALTSAPKAVLWLYASHPRVQANLRAAAVRHGVAEHRLIFAPGVAHDVHLGRLCCADLALDTLPYGSHTTGVDALWAGVPLLTCRGETFAGRVGASLLKAVELDELVTEDLDQYRTRLVELSNRPEQLRAYRAHLQAGRRTLPLWDTNGFATDFERLLANAYDAIATVRF